MKCSFLFIPLALSATFVFLSPAVHGLAKRPDSFKSLNIVLITADDLGFDSVGVYGSAVPNITPNLDQFATEGMKFEHAHVVAAVCQPSRQSMMTGRYPHANGALGFDPISDEVPTLQEHLRAAGYMNGVLGKEKHLRPMERYCWDYMATEDDLADGAGIGRSLEAYRAHTRQFIARAKAENKPFFLMANMHDPHRPYADSQQERDAWGHDLPSFRRRVTEEEVVVPGFLPDIPLVRKEIAQYFTSVYRCDEIIGAVLQVLEETGQAENSLVMFISDNGMSFPFAKSNCYLQSTKTPLLVRWPGKVEPGSVDATHPVSGIDYMPTVLDAIGAMPPEGMNGSSFLPLLEGREQPERKFVFTEYTRTFAGINYPMRAVQGPRFGYLINFWAGRTGPMRMESTSGLSYDAMEAAAEHDEQIASRVELFDNRVLEEFYDFANDPDGLHNLIDDPKYQDEIAKMRDAMAERMKQTDDPALEAFLRREDPAKIDAFMQEMKRLAEH
jgi:N-sulfoglucosamine sulfohydrolase